jgi:MoxR-like ATPase
MRIGKVASTLVKVYNDQATRERAVFLLGPSGIGKSAVVWQAAEELGIPVIDLRLAQCDPVDLRGVPSVQDGVTVWNRPDFFPGDDQPAGILFLDEITSAPQSIQAVAYQLVLDRKVGSYRLPDGWMIVAAGNRANDRGVTFAMAAPLLNRMTQLEVDTTLDDWREYAAMTGVRPEILAFVSDRADFLHKYDRESYGKQFPSPRGWHAVSNILNLGLDDADRIEMTKGAVGHEAAVGFESFLRVWETMPRLDTILSDPDSVEVPSELNVRYCVTMGLSARITKANFNNAWSFLQRMPKELQTLCVKFAYQRDRTIAQATKFHEWATANQDAFRRV